MTHTASRHVAIWIDRYQTILLGFEANPLDGSVPHGRDGGWSQYFVDAQDYPGVHQYYDAVVYDLGPGDEIWILGPGQAKYELRQHIEEHGGLKGKVVGLHHALQLAEVELVCPTSQVRHYG
jgi:hypothetical protein